MQFHAEMIESLYSSLLDMCVSYCSISGTRTEILVFMLYENLFDCVGVLC